MATVCPGNLPSKRKEMIVRELVLGHQLANQLKGLLQIPTRSDESLSSAYEDLVVKIQTSFTHSISLLTSGESDGEVCENLPVSGGDNTSSPAAASLDDRRSEDSRESRKRPTAPAGKRSRGSYKRRKTTVQTWTKIEPTVEDGRAWRKYGQKEILNSKYPRSYFRCTRKYDQGCRATKQVQRMDGDPDRYHITYIGVHTCKETSKTPQMITSECEPWEAFLDNNEHDCEKHGEYSQHFRSSLLSIPTIQQRYSKRDAPTITDFAADSLSLLDSCCPWPDFKGNLNEQSQTSTAAIMFSKMENDHKGDAIQYSCTDTGSKGIFGMEFEVDSVHFDDTNFHFDENDQFLISK